MGTDAAVSRSVQPVLSLSVQEHLFTSYYIFRHTTFYHYLQVADGGSGKDLAIPLDLASRAYGVTVEELNVMNAVRNWRLLKARQQY